MNTKEIEDTVDKHAQKYLASCAPSLAEMLLKVRKSVGSDYSAEQDRDQNTNIGLGNIKNKTIAGQTFRHVQDTPSAEPFAKRIDDLLAADKPVGIFLQNPDGFHGFVIAGKENGNYVLFSKHSELGNGEGKLTLRQEMTEAELNAVADRDAIFLE